MSNKYPIVETLDRNQAIKLSIGRTIREQCREGKRVRYERYRNQIQRYSCKKKQVVTGIWIFMQHSKINLNI